MANDTGKSFHNGLVPIVHYPYIKITLKNGVSFTQNPLDAKPDFFISLEHKRYIDQANTVSINITFVPKGNNNDGQIGDPNLLEIAMRDSGGKMRFQYGTTQDSKNISKEYNALIYNYTVNIQDGAISYAISAVSTAVLANFDEIKENLFTIKSTDSPDQVFMKLNGVIEGSTLNNYYTFDRKNSPKTFKINKQIDAPGKTPMQYFMEVARALVDTEDEINHFYKVVVDDTDNGNGKRNIRLARTSSVCVGNYVFQWGGKNTDVISWRPDYQGAFAIFNDTSSNIYKNLSNVITRDQGGNATLAQIESFDVGGLQDLANTELKSTSSISLEETATLSTSKVQSFREKVQYPYKASLTVLGVGGQDLQLGSSLIKVTPVINGKTHHSAGEYTIIGITDSVSSQGFMTTFDLFRYVKVEGAANSLNDKDGTTTKKNPVNPDGTKTNSQKKMDRETGKGILTQSKWKPSSGPTHR